MPGLRARDRCAALRASLSRRPPGSMAPGATAPYPGVVTGYLYRGSPRLAEINATIMRWRAQPETAPPDLAATLRRRRDRDRKRRGKETRRDHAAA